MSKWDAAKFADWMDRNGLRASDAANVLRLTRTSVQRVKSGAQALHPLRQDLAVAFEERRTVSDDVDEMAATADLAETCAAVHMAVVTGVTAAAVRGWTSASTHDRYVVLPVRFAAMSVPDGVVTIGCPQLPNRVEIRTDVEGRPYRLADPVRTVVDMLRDDVRQGEFHAEEVIRAALSDGVSPDDIRLFAEPHGPEVEAKIDRYLALVAQ